MSNDWGEIIDDNLFKIRKDFEQVLAKHPEVKDYILNYKDIEVN